MSEGAGSAEQVEAGASATSESSTSDSSASGHGAIAGAEEVAEPPLQLVSISAEGDVGVLDLLDGTASRLGAIDAPSMTATDGRYVLATTDAGVEIVDSGVWTWDHVDHFHYYRAEPTMLGRVVGEGPVVVGTGMLSTAGSTGIFFSGSQEAVLLDNEALSHGEIVETFRIPADGLIAPLGAGALVASDEAGELRFVGADGEPTGASAPCADAAGTIATRVGVVVGCADGAVVATIDRGEPVFETVAYQEGVDGGRAQAFDGRKGRPTVAATSGDAGFWLLDTRELVWTRVDAEAPIVRVTAVDDADEHVVALDADGRVRVFAGGTGEQTAVTEPLLPVASEGSVPDGVSLVVDAQRAYLNAPGAGTVLEIAYADGARIARELEPPVHPDLFAEVGR